MSNTTTKVERKSYPFLNTVYYHGANVKTALDIGLRAVVIVAVIVGTIKLALA